jgi:hypothetical protein
LVKKRIEGKSQNTTAKTITEISKAWCCQTSVNFGSKKKKPAESKPRKIVGKNKTEPWRRTVANVRSAKFLGIDT